MSPTAYEFRPAPAATCDPQAPYLTLAGPSTMLAHHQAVAQLPAPPAGYDPVADNGWLGAYRLYQALRPTMSAAQLQLAGPVLDELQARCQAHNAAALARTAA